MFRAPKINVLYVWIDLVTGAWLVVAWLGGKCHHPPSPHLPLKSSPADLLVISTFSLQLLTVVHSVTHPMVWWRLPREQHSTKRPPTPVTVCILWLEMRHVPARQMEIGLGQLLPVVSLVTNYLHPGRTYNHCTAAVLHQYSPLWWTVCSCNISWPVKVEHLPTYMYIDW